MFTRAMGTDGTGNYALSARQSKKFIQEQPEPDLEHCIQALPRFQVGQQVDKGQLVCQSRWQFARATGLWGQARRTRIQSTILCDSSTQCHWQAHLTLAAGRAVRGTLLRD